MPTDYSKSVIYKITCKDPSISKMYFGSTANIADRRRKHKHNYSNKSGTKYTIALYDFSRKNGGWENWTIEIVAEYPCNSRKELRIEEQRYIDNNGGCSSRGGSLLNVLDAYATVENKKKTKLDGNAAYRDRHREEIKNKANLKYREKKEGDPEKYQAKLEANRAYQDVYREANRDMIKNKKNDPSAKHNQRTECECGGRYVNKHKSTHIATPKHQKWEASQLNL